LFGRRPFADESVERLREPRRAVPARVLEVVRRGLAFEPSGRFPSMAALIEALAYEPPSRRAWWIGGAAVAAAAVVTTLLVRGTPRELCTDAETKLAGIWDVGRRFEVRLAFAKSRAPYLAGAVDHVERALDRYAATWLDTYVDVCRATRVRGDQSERV